MDLQRNPLVPSHDGSSQLPTFWLLKEMVKVRKGETNPIGVEDSVKGYRGADSANVPITPHYPCYRVD